MFEIKNTCVSLKFHEYWVIHAQLFCWNNELVTWMQHRREIFRLLCAILNWSFHQWINVSGLFTVLGNRCWTGEQLHRSDCSTRCCYLWWSLCTCKLWPYRAEGIYWVFFLFNSCFSLWFHDCFLIECFHLAE